MGIDANDIQFFLQQVLSHVANSCLTFVRQYPFVVFASLCLLFFDLFFPRVFVFVFHSFPVFIIAVVSLVLFGGNAKNVVEKDKGLNHEISLIKPQNVDFETINMFDKSTWLDEDDDVVEVNHRETFAHERFEPVPRHDDTKQCGHADKVSLKNILVSEMERNRRLESLTAKRKARKLLSMQVRNTLLNMGKNNSPSPIGSLNIPKSNPLLSHNPSFISPTPGSAPSVLLPAKNPFGGIDIDNTSENKSQNPPLRRVDSFDEKTSLKKSSNSLEKRDIEMGRGNTNTRQSSWVASSHLNNIEEDESRSGEVHEVSNQDIIDVGFSSLVSKSDKEEDHDIQHVPAIENSDEETEEDMFMESLRKLTTPKASQNTPILKERLAHRLSREDEGGASTSQVHDHPQIDPRMILGPAPSPRSVLQPNLSSINSSICIKIEQEGSSPNQEDTPTEERNADGNPSLDTKDVHEIANPNDVVKDYSPENTQPITSSSTSSDDPSHSTQQLRIEISN